MLYFKVRYKYYDKKLSKTTNYTIRSMEEDL
jgi:hypothetical protein